MKLFGQNFLEIEWPNDWPQPTKGANAGPLLGQVAFEALKADIDRNGLYDPIHFTSDGRISKGRNRYRALRELRWSHERIVKEASVTVESSDSKDALSNIMRVHRTKCALVASYLLAHPKELKLLVDERKKKTGPAHFGVGEKIAATVGCNPSVVTRVVDRLSRSKAADYQEVLTGLANDWSYSVDFPAPRVERTEQGHLEITNTGEVGSLEENGAQTPEDQKEGGARLRDAISPLPSPPQITRDRRTLPPEKKKAILAAIATGSGKNKIAKTHGVSSSTVQALKKQQAAPESKAKADPVSDKLLSMWRKYGGKEVTADLFGKFIADALSIPGTASVVKASLKAIKL